jgi:hypothetical protein
VIEAPEGGGVVPSVVEDEGVELDVAFLDEFGTEGVNAIKGAGLGVAILVADVVPGVVIQERLVGARTYALNVREKIAA